MDAIQTILSHRSIRKYKSTDISDSDINEILLSASKAATTGNMQVYSIIVTKDNKIKEELLPAHFGQKMIIEAPVVMTFCADFNRFNLWCESHKAKPGYDNFISFQTATIDALIAAQNAVIAAENKGIGTCYIGTTIYNADKIIQTLNIPKGVIPIATITMGYPAEEVELSDRLPLSGIVHYEKYKNYNSEDINNIFSEKENMPFYKKIVSDNNVDSLAHVFTEKRYKKNDNIFFSKALLKVLKDQGFMEND